MDLPSSAENERLNTGCAGKMRGCIPDQSDQAMLGDAEFDVSDPLFQEHCEMEMLLGDDDHNQELSMHSSNSNSSRKRM